MNSIEYNIAAQSLLKKNLTDQILIGSVILSLAYDLIRG